MRRKAAFAVSFASIEDGSVRNDVERGRKLSKLRYFGPLTPSVQVAAKPNTDIQLNDNGPNDDNLVISPVGDVC